VTLQEIIKKTGEAVIPYALEMAHNMVAALNSADNRCV
jgi:hypothetical protein